MLIDIFGFKYNSCIIKSNYLLTSTFFHERYICLKLLLKIFKENTPIVYFDESSFNFCYEKKKQLFDKKNNKVMRNIKHMPT